MSIPDELDYQNLEAKCRWWDGAWSSASHPQTIPKPMSILKGQEYLQSDLQPIIEEETGLDLQQATLGDFSWTDGYTGWDSLPGHRNQS